MTISKARERSEEPARPRLGRGLAALLADTTAPQPEGGGAGREQKLVEVEFLRPNPRNPRRQFDADDLNDLAESIRSKGIIQPIVVRAIRNVAGSYEIIAGERRWRAAQAAALTEVPVVVVEADDREALAFAIIENVQRADLNAVEEARGYERLGAEFGYSQSELSAIIGKSRSHVANTLRLLRLPDSITALLAGGQISAGHARALLSLDDPEPVARQIVDQGLTVRDVERLAQQQADAKAAREPLGNSLVRASRASADPAHMALARRLGEVLGLRVTHKNDGTAGEIRIRYSSAAELAALRQRLLGDGDRS